MKLVSFAVGGLLALGLAQPALAQEADDGGKTAGSLMVRARVIGVLPDTTSSITPIGGQVDATNSIEPEVDGTYFFTDNWAAELIAATTRHHVTANATAAGNIDVGQVRLLPPTLTLQYHFLPHDAFSPYLGAGVNYTWFFDPTVSHVVVQHVSYENNFGAALQAGVDYEITGRWYANLDVKHLFLSTTARINGGAVRAAVNLDPTMVGAGLGYRF